MLDVFMLPRSTKRFLQGFLPVCAIVLTACESTPLLAPTGSTIVLSAGNTALSAGDTMLITAQVLEQAGTPPHSGTRVTFTTSLGLMEPAFAGTDQNGIVIVRFRAGPSNGTATITAISGGASTGTTGALKIAVGTAAVGKVTVSANPATVPAIGGSTTISANVLDLNGNILSATPVVFTTTAGTLSAAVVNTNSSGVASAVLTTGQAATVTASVGAATTTPPATGGGTTPSTGTGQASASVTVTVSTAPTIVITPPTSPPSAGVPSNYTFVVTTAANTGSAVRDVTVTWGDGDTSTLGAITGSQVVAHVYASSGTKTIRATVTDAAGNTSTVSTSVTVIVVPRPTIIVTPTPQSQTVNGTITFNIQITMPAGIGVQNTSIYFGGGGGGGDETRSLGGATSASVQKVYTTVGARTVVVSVLDTTGNVTEGTAAISVTP